MSKQMKVSCNLQQDFTAEEKKTARDNIGAPDIKYLSSSTSQGPVYNYASEVMLSNSTNGIYVKPISGNSQLYALSVPVTTKDGINLYANRGSVLTVTDPVNNTIEWKDNFGINMQLLTTETVNVDSYNYTLNIEEGKAYLLNCDESASDITLSTNVTNHSVYTIICINADGVSSCPSVRIKWKDEALGNCESVFQFQDTTSNAEYLMHVYIQKLYSESSQQYYSVARVMDYPVAYRSIPEQVDTQIDSVVQVGAAY